MNKLINIRKLKVKIKIIFSLMIALNFHLTAAALDSLRLESHNGKNFVIHKVNKGQTLLSTLRRYGCSLNDFKVENPGVDLNINIDQKLRIPYNRTISSIPKVVVSNNKSFENNEDEKTIIVQSGMTLFSIAKKYGLTLQELKELNNSNSNVAKLGEKLIVRGGKKNNIIADVPTSTSKHEIETSNNNKIIVREVPAIESKKTDDILIKEEVKVKPILAETTSKPKVVTEILKAEKIVDVKPKVVAELPKVESKKSIPVKEASTVPVVDEEYSIRDKKIEEGIAEFISVESNSGKYLALHKTAPSGTLIQVKNETNGASVWVKVIGKLPEVDQNENIVIKLSPKAFNRVSPIDRKFRAKLSYIVSR